MAIKRDYPRSNTYLGYVDEELRNLTGDGKRVYVRRKLWERDGELCGFCHEPVAFEVMQLDHIIPRCMNGPDHHENLRPSHRKCNVRGAVPFRKQKPAVPVRKMVAVNIEPELYEQLREIAKRNTRTLPRQILYLAKLAIQNKLDIY